MGKGMEGTPVCSFKFSLEWPMSLTEVTTARDKRIMLKITVPGQRLITFSGGALSYSR